MCNISQSYRPNSVFVDPAHRRRSPQLLQGSAAPAGLCLEAQAHDQSEGKGIEIPKIYGAKSNRLSGTAELPPRRQRLRHTWRERSPTLAALVVTSGPIVMSVTHRAGSVKRSETSGLQVQ